MNTKQFSYTTVNRVIWLAFGLAMATAVGYLLINFRVLSTGDYDLSEAPKFIVYFTTGGYLLGGLLILLRRRWLWIVGTCINTLVMFVFFKMHRGDNLLFLSPAGLVSKILQILLEFALLYMIIFYSGNKGTVKA